MGERALRKLTLLYSALVLCGALSVAPPDAGAEAEKPALSEQELAERCRAALRDLRTFCSSEFHRRGLSLPPALPAPLETQQTPPGRGPGSEFPELPRSNGRFECLDAQRRVDQYCVEEKSEPRGNVVSNGEATPSS